MGFVMYVTCDICGARIDDKTELEDADVSIVSGRIAMKMCTRCQNAWTVAAAKTRLRDMSRKAWASQEEQPTKGPSVMPTEEEATTDATTPDPDEEKSAKIAGLKAQIAEIEGKEEGQRDEGDTDTKPRIETNNKFGVNTRDGAICVGNNLALVNGVNARDAINLAAWLTIVADRNAADDEASLDIHELYNAIVDANPES